MWKDNETNKDLLGYQVHASLLRDVILDENMLPISIGIFGNWGSGKSSLMLLVQEEISKWINETNESDRVKKGKKENTNVLQIQFNSWQFESYENTKLVLIESILDSLSKDVEDKRSLLGEVGYLLNRIKFLKVGTLALKKITNFILPEEIKELLPTKDELKECLKEDESQNLIEEIKNGNTSQFISEFRKIFKSIIVDAKYRAVIVYIDDLDRCNSERVIECLEAVKLFLNVEKTAFVIGADVRMIEFAISQHYPLKTEKEKHFSPFSDYLEKLIQLPYKLPKLSYGEQETYIFLLLCQQLIPEHFHDIHNDYVKFREKEKHSKYDIEKVKKSFPDLSLDLIEKIIPIVPLMNRFLNGNPRQLKRFLNTFDIRRRMARVAGFEEEIDPTILVKLMVLEYNSIYLPRFEELFERQMLNDGFINDIELIEKTATDSNTISEAGWTDKWSIPLLVDWMKMKPSLANKNLQNYFWISRESLDETIPVETIVSNSVLSFYRAVKNLQAVKTMTPQIVNSVGKFTPEEKDMLVMLMNSDLRQDINHKKVWLILQADETNLIFDRRDRLKLLFGKLATQNIQPLASFFINRIKGVSSEYEEYINTVSFSDRLNNALKQ